MVFKGSLLELGVESIAVRTEDMEQLRFDLGEQIHKLDICREQDRSGTLRAAGELGRERHELLNGTATLGVGNEVTKLTK